MTVHTVGNGVDKRPYVGSRAFRSEDSNRFYGRSTESHDVAALWRANRLTVLHGSSGVGKTSLLRAGVIPLLDQVATEVLPPGRVSHSSAFPLAALPEHNPYTFALLSSWSPDEPATGLAGLAVPEFLRRGKRTDWHGRPLPVFAAIDQAEELFADPTHQNRHRRPFIDELIEALDEHPHLHLLLSIRESSRIDFSLYEHDLGRDSLARFELLPLRPEAALEAASGPLSDTDRSFAPGAAEGLVDSLRTSEVVSVLRQRRSVIAEDIEPALLQIVCSQLWDALPGDIKVITSHELRTYADPDRTLAAFCGRALAAMAEEHNLHLTELRSWLQRTFITELGERSTVAENLTQTAGMPNTVVRALENKHILKAERRSGSRWYELQHDSLIEPIQRMDDTVLGPPPRVKPADEYLRTAAEALAAGELALAEAQAERALRTSANTDLRLRAEAESFLGNIAHERGEPTKAEARYRAATKLFEMLQNTPAVARLLAAIGQSLLAQGRRAEAVKQLHAAVERVPNDLTVQTELGWTLWHQGQQRAALAVLDGVLGIDGNAAEALRVRGEILADMGEADRALRDLDRVRRQQRPSTRAARGLALATLRHLDEADEEIKTALTEAPDSGPVLLYAARVAALDGDPVVAADRARRARDATDPPLPPHQRETALGLLSQESS